MRLIRSILFNIVFFSILTLTMVLGYPLVFLNNQRHVFAFWRYLSMIMNFITAKIGGIDYVIENEENIPKEAAIYAIRHESMWETLILIHKFNEPVFVLKEELLKIPLFGALSKEAGAIAIDRNNGVKSLKGVIGQVEAAIAQGHPVIIFPEGTRMPSGIYVHLKRGIALFYKKANCCVVPIIHNSGRFWPRRKFIKKSGTITVRIINPIAPGLSSDEFMDKLNDVFSAEVKKLEIL